mgnify:FL=1
MRLSIKKYKGGMYSLKSTDIVNTSIEDAWNFFKQPKNLSKLSPDNVNFKIISGKSDTFYEGKIISYKIKLFPLISINWTSEIIKIDEGRLFIDKQLFGPYKLWHHEHHFKDNMDGTTTITDHVKYKLFFHPLSKIVHRIFIKKKLLSIFSFRRKAIKNIFESNIL